LRLHRLRRRTTQFQKALDPVLVAYGGETAQPAPTRPTPGREAEAALPTCGPDDQRCVTTGADGEAVREECFWAALELARRRLSKRLPDAPQLRRPSSSFLREAARRFRVFSL